MKLSEHLLKTLQNFVSINSGIVIRKSNGESYIHTIDNKKQIYANSKVEEQFPCNICIYDLKAFLNIASSMIDADVEFKEDRVIISNENMKTKIMYADPSVIFHIDQVLPNNDGDFSFDLQESSLQQLLSNAALLKLEHLRLVTEDGILYLQAEDKNNPKTNEFKVKVAETDEECDLYFKRENMLMVPGDYTVKVHKNSFLIFEHAVNKDLYYLVVLDKQEKRQ